MSELTFLVFLAIIWIVFAVIQDLRKREIANWLNFSLIAFALGFRLFYSLFVPSASEVSFGFFYQGLIGLGVFFALGNIFYYGKLFAGGDAKLMIALGPVLPFSEILAENLETFTIFLLVFLFAGAIYSLIASFWVGLKNHEKLKKEFAKQFKRNRNLFNLSLLIAIALVIFGFFINPILFYLAILFFVMPYLYVYAKAIDESCMVKKVETSKLTEGDWLYRDVKIANKVIKAKWDGLDNKEIKELRKRYKTILVRHGIPFSPVFLISFLILVYLRNPFW